MTARTVRMPDSQLSRAITHEPAREWPTKMAVVATWEEGDKVITVSKEISPDEFFGEGTYGAPITGESLVSLIDRLRKVQP